ncbi:hypothetical protein THIAE_09630 [Thiomicrospira aerophila AL3]|uniref:Uncharacterized protein n=1 Tax=Thiomicrospira aerophila AL3 TaxID=717772 RepID=W0DZW2_9GAMM|nr:hypothetical protein [Thiomicrospira aerophila]AHF02391.1 hypothetical protein THIAE_09630 [Thiomicrospira aerophila AL3]
MNNDKIDSIFFKILKYISIILAVFLGVLFATLVLTKFNIDPVSWLLNTVKGVFYKQNSPLTIEEQEALSLLIKNGRILPSDGIITQVTSFYSTIITFLLGLIALISGMAFVYIKAQSYEKMEIMTEKKVEEYFKTAELTDKLDILVKSKTEDIRQNLKLDLDDFSDWKDNIENRLNTVEERNNGKSIFSKSPTISIPDGYDEDGENK